MSWQRFVARFQEGDEVRSNRGFLDSARNPVDPKAKGKITRIEEQNGMRYATVEWDRPGIPDLINVANLARVKTVGRG